MSKKAFISSNKDLKPDSCVTMIFKFRFSKVVSNNEGGAVSEWQSTWLPNREPSVKNPGEDWDF